MWEVRGHGGYTGDCCLQAQGQDICSQGENVLWLLANFFLWYGTYLLSFLLSGTGGGHWYSVRRKKPRSCFSHLQLTRPPHPWFCVCWTSKSTYRFSPIIFHLLLKLRRAEVARRSPVHMLRCSYVLAWLNSITLLKVLDIVFFGSFLFRSPCLRLHSAFLSWVHALISRSSCAHTGFP